MLHSALAVLAAVLPGAVAQPVSGQTSTISDPVGDAFFQNTLPFQDVIFGQMTKTADGDFELLMEMAGDVPANPVMTPPQRTEDLVGMELRPRHHLRSDRLPVVDEQKFGTPRARALE